MYYFLKSKLLLRLKNSNFELPKKTLSTTQKVLSQQDFSEKIITWYNANKRDLPWRNTQNPYYIWLSEIILQQTRVAQGQPYYERFVEKYPTLKDLANAPTDDVLRLWQGLGYYSRARICTKLLNIFLKICKISFL